VVVDEIHHIFHNLIHMYFYIPDLDAQKIVKSSADHLFTMRIKKNDVVEATNLQGTWAKIRITQVDKHTRTIHFAVVKQGLREKPKEKILLQAMTDKHYLEKLVELLPPAGITHLYVFESDYTPVGSVNMERLDNILTRSCEQSQTCYKPHIEIVNKNLYTSLIEKYKPVVLDGNTNTSSHRDNDNTNAVLVGPEGGWSQQEIDYFKGQKLVFQSLGSTVFPAWLAGYTWFAQQK
jgi:RsmE family RNA methyltransferase